MNIRNRAMPFREKFTSLFSRILDSKTAWSCPSSQVSRGRGLVTVSTVLSNWTAGAMGYAEAEDRERGMGLNLLGTG